MANEKFFKIGLSCGGILWKLKKANPNADQLPSPNFVAVVFERYNENLSGGKNGIRRKMTVKSKKDNEIFKIVSIHSCRWNPVTRKKLNSFGVKFERTGSKIFSIFEERNMNFRW